MALKIIIRDVKLKSAGGGYRHQRVNVRTTDYHGGKVWRECFVPLATGEEPYQPGVYELAERSFYVDRPTQQLKLMPRLRYVRGLDALPGETAGDQPAIAAA